MSIRYKSAMYEIDKHIDTMAGIIEQRCCEGSPFEDGLEISILAASIDAQELLPSVPAIMTLSDEHINWKYICSRLIEKAKNVKL